MAEPSQGNLKALTRRLLTNTELNSDEIEVLENLPMQVKTLPRQHDIIREGERPSHSCALLEGWLFRYRVIPDGGRQIMSFHIPGEIPDLHSLHVAVMDHSVATLTPCKVAFIAHEHLDNLTVHHPRIAMALWRDTLIDAGIFREWMVGIGRRLAFGRIAHLFCEMYRRLEIVGLAEGKRMNWPVMQIDLADATSMTAVHVNRTLRDMRRRGLVTIQDGVLTIHDWPALIEAADFDPTYLHLREAQT